jgi:hypothetical protein
MRLVGTYYVSINNRFLRFCEVTLFIAIPIKSILYSIGLQHITSHADFIV